MKKNLKYFLIIYLILRIPLFIIKLDIDEFSVANILFEAYRLNNIPIYETHCLYYPNQLYPPLFYYIAYILYYVGGTYLSLKFFWLIFDFFCLIFIYKIGNEIFESKKEQELLISLYLLCPFIFLLVGLRGLGEIVTLFFILSSFYYFIKKQYILSYVLLSLGILYGFFPILLIIPYFLFLINEKGEGLKNIFLFIPIFLSIFITISLPFILTYGSDFLDYILSIIFRSDYSIGVYKMLPEFFDWAVISIELFNFTIAITYFMILQFVLILLSLFIFVTKFKVNSEKKLINTTLFFFLLVPILSKSFHFRILLWIFPFFLLFLINIQPLESISNKIIRRYRNYQLILFSIGNCIVLAFFIFFLNTNPNFGFSRSLIYYLLLIYSLIWGFFLLSMNLLKLLILELYILFYCFYLYFFIIYGYDGVYILIFLLIYCIICSLTSIYIFKNWKQREVSKTI